MVTTRNMTNNMILEDAYDVQVNTREILRRRDRQMDEM